tara:strand:+ start:18360 stop:21068 length:2709 start_codon:yes stop_codon:yes gene_type:complete
MTVPLGIRHAKTGVATDGWFVPGEHVDAWLQEVLGFAFPWRSTKLLPIANLGGGNCLGVLVIPPMGVQPHRVVRARPYRLRADHVWLPMDAELWPPVGDEELVDLCGGRTMVCHPSAGFVSFSPDEVRGLDDLLQAPTFASNEWDQAQPGIVVVGGIVEVTANTAPDLGALFQQDRDEIGNQTPDKLPPLPGEPRSGGRRFLPGVGGWLARGVFFMTRGVPRTADKETWIDRLEGWARRFESHGHWRDQSQREREVNRLLQLLQDDPSRGLRFALPIGGGGGDRGEALPANQLGERDAEFNLSHLGGGGSADFWDLPSHVHTRLAQSYRELANAEIAAGRYRRAAYIFAHLLGDLRAAAQTLAQGGFHREAAVLYKERLDDPASASRCLVAGGYLLEAAQLEEGLQHYERAGDLRLILRHGEQARALYDLELQVRMKAEQWVAAAILRAERLRDVDGALALLHEQAARGHRGAFAAWLALSAKAGHHADVLHAVRTRRVSELGVADLAKVLGAYAQRVGPGEVRDASRSRVRELIAEHLPMATGSASISLLTAMRQCSPQDRVLMHDLRVVTDELLPKWKQPEFVARSGRVRLKRGDVALTAKSVKWQSAAVDDSGLWLAGHDRDTGEARVYSYPWEGDDGTVSVDLTSEPRLDMQLHRSHHRGRALMGLRSHGPSRSARFEWLTNGGVRTDRLDLEGIAMAVDDEDSIWELRWAGDGLVLQRSTAARQLVHTMSLVGMFEDSDLELQEELGLVVEMVALRDRVMLLVGDEVVIADRAGGMRRGTLPQVGRCIVRSEEACNPLVLVGFDEGFCAVDIVKDDLQSFVVRGLGLRHPTVGWTRHGVAIAVDRDAIWIARMKSGALPDPVFVDYRHGQPWAIVPTPRPDEVAFVLEQAFTRIRLI